MHHDTRVGPSATRRGICGLLAGLTLLLTGAVVAGAAADRGGAPWSPPPGDPVRKAVLDALRAEVRRLHHLEVVFVVDALRVQDGWAWVETQPQSLDAQSHYESLAALLAKRGGTWTVVAYPCADSDEPECDWDAALERLRRRFPAAPAGIFGAADEWVEYQSPGTGVRFRYPADWQVIEDGHYAEAAQAGRLHARVILAPRGADAEHQSNDWIRLNPQQFMPGQGTCVELGDDRFCTYSDSPQVLAVLHQMAEHFSGGH